MSDSDDDEFVVYGTGLEPLDEDDIPRKRALTLEDQVVKDAQGRRRFHGAFTGGFSAGFFNTVGSLEGWTPSSFKSSRSERIESKTQRPEDFMDDEDTGEFGIAPKVLRATSDFSHLKRTRQRTQHTFDGPIPGEPVLKLLLEPVRETAGARLLRCMGWRPGQGVGPREAPRPPRPRVVGCAPPPGLGGEEEDDEEEEEEAAALAAAGVTLAPEDAAPFLARPKADAFGLGYEPLARRPVLSAGPAPAHAPGPAPAQRPRALRLGGPRGGSVAVTGQAFGVGALEEEDEDIYSTEDMSQYDFALGGPAPAAASRASAAPAQHDNYLHNFCKDLAAAVKDFFPPPALPRAFRPEGARRRSRFDQPGPPPAPAQGASHQCQAPRVLTTDDRAVLVGGKEEEELEREQLRAAALKLTEGLQQEQRGSKPLGSFVPFAAHPEKQRRYEQYLALKRAGQPEKLMHLQPLNMNEWERHREKAEFEQAARLFQPLSAEMGERFVSASQPDDATNTMTPVEKLMGGTAEQQNAAKMKMFGKLTREEEPWQPCDLLCKRFNIAKPIVSGSANTGSRKNVSVFDYLKAVPQNKFQVKTAPSAELSAATTAIVPSASEAQTEPETHETVLKSTELGTETEPHVTALKSTELGTETEPHVTALTSTEVKTEPELASAPENIQPTESKKEKTQESSEDFFFPEPAEKIDLFKAIFLSSSESEDEEEKTKQDKESVPVIEVHPPVEVSHLVASAPAENPVISSEARKRPPLVASSARSGVFANLDLDALNCPATSTFPASERKNSERDEPKTSSATVPPQDNFVYGPRPPTSLSSGASTGRTLPSVVAPTKHNSLTSEWVERTSLHKKKKGKKKKKEKKHKDKKSKSKHKKHKHDKK